MTSSDREERREGTAPVAVISGGAGGLGRALAAALLARGWRVAVIDRDVSELVPASGLSLYTCDLTEPEALSRTCARLLADHGRADLVIYNAGITQIGPFAELDAATHRKVFEVNYFAAMAMAGHFLQALRDTGGAHLAISSVAGFTPLLNRCAYVASKHALEGAFKSLRSEERAYGVQVQIAAPSFVATNIGRPERETSGIARPGSAADGMDYVTPEAAAAEILRGLARGRPMIPVGRVARLAWWVNRLSPSLFQRLMERSVSGQPDP